MRFVFTCLKALSTQRGIGRSSLTLLKSYAILYLVHKLDGHMVR